MVCDLAETYHIFDYKAHDPMMIMRLVAGLRQDSRLYMKLSEQSVSQDTLLLGAVIDKLSLILSAMTGDRHIESIVDKLLEKEEKDNNIMAFESAEDFIIRRYGG